MREILRNLAILEAIVCPEWEYRYFSYNARWSENEEMASMRDGQGTEWFAWFKSGATGYKYFSPEDGLMKNLEDTKQELPIIFSEFINEPAFSMHLATCIWYKESNDWVRLGKEVVSSLGIDQVTMWKAQDYCNWAADYYERVIPQEPASQILAGIRNKDIALELNSDLDWEIFETEMKESGL